MEGAIRDTRYQPGKKPLGAMGGGGWEEAVFPWVAGKGGEEVITLGIRNGRLKEGKKQKRKGKVVWGAILGDVPLFETSIVAMS